ncbi:hypothetical protein NX059_008856 [Plenodomus lindquistii]|nr:hypothetical protein NX059_008856 [Plenodomus lindquistii]
MSSASNHYKTLGVDASADTATIKKAYRHVALLNHPDKTAHLSAVEIEARTKVFKLANTAHRILTDAKLRRDYDLTLPYSVRFPGAAPRRPPPQPQPQPKAAPEPDKNVNGSMPRAFTMHSRPPPQQPLPNDAPQYTPHPQSPLRTPPSVPPEENPFLRGWRPGPTSGFGMPQWAPRPHPFTSGQRPSTFKTPPPTRWFYAPVDETDRSTTVSYSNHEGWDFSIGVSKKHTWTGRPELPPLNSDTSSAVRIRINMQRQTPTYTNSLLKDVRIKMKRSPKDQHVRFTSTFIESKTSGFGLAIRLVLVSDEEHRALSSLAPSWAWSFDADQGFLMPFYNSLRVSHVMYFPLYPQHGFGEEGGVPEAEPYPQRSPHEYLVRTYPGMQFLKMSKGFYCREEMWSGKKFWRLVAVGSI